MVPLSGDVNEAARAASRPVVDREDALAAVDATLGEVEESGGRTLLVSGEPGVGKSALLSAVRARAEDRGFVVHAAAAEQDVADPFGPVVRAFEGSDTGVVRQLRDRDGPVPDDPDAFRAQRAAQFHDVADELRAMATIDPVALVVDDLQWADGATLSLFAHFAEAIREWIYPVVLVGAHRPLAGSEGRAADVVERVAALDRTRTVSLDPLDRPATRSFLGDLLGDDPPPGFVDLVMAVTDGNPLFVREAVAGWRVDGVVDPASGTYPTVDDADPATGTGTTLPGDVTDALARHLDGRTEGERTLLRAAAALGDVVPVETLASVLGRARADVVDDASRLATDELVAVEDGRVRFRTGVVRAAVRATAPDRPEWHEVAATTLLDADDGSTRAAYAAGVQLERAGDHERARQQFATAAERAMAAFAPSVAADAYRRARTLAVEDDVARAHALDVGRAHLVLGEDDAAEEWFRTAQAEADDPAAHARADLAAADRHIHRSEFELAVQAADEGLDRGDLPNDLRRRLLATRGEATIQGGELATARSAYERAVDVADDEEARADALVGLGVAERRAGDLEHARELLTEAVEIADGGGDDETLARARRKLAVVDGQLGDVEAAADNYRRVIRTLQDRGDVAELPTALMDLATCYYNLGRLDEALSRFETTAEMAAKVDREYIRALSLGNIALTHLETGDLASAAEYAERSIDMLADQGRRDRAAFRQGTLAYAQFLADDDDRALATVERALATARDTSQKYAIGYLLLYRGWFRRAAGDLAGAVADHEEGAAVLSELGNTRFEADSRSQLGLDHAAAGSEEAALAAAERALELIADSGQVLAAARVRARLGRVRRIVGDLEGAADALTAALDEQEAADNVLEACWTTLELARLARDRGDAEAARDHLAALRELADGTGFERFDRLADEVAADLE